MSPAPELYHQDIAGEIYTLLKSHVRRNKLGKVWVAPAVVVLEDATVIEPDVVFVAKERFDIITAKNIQGPPDLAVEVVSPFSSRRDRVRKFDLYERSGIANYWIVDLKYKSIEEYILRDQKYFQTKDWQQDEVFIPTLFPGLEISLTELFAGDDDDDS